jgi:phosphatidylserine synthase
MSEDVPYFSRQLRRHASHYYGDYVRILFVISAVMIFFLHFTNKTEVFPISVSLSMIVGLVVAAGLTNVVQVWTQWVNVILSGLLLILFGELTFRRFQDFNIELLLQNLMIASLSILFVVALYLAVRTLRGSLMRGAPIIR